MGTSSSDRFRAPGDWGRGRVPLRPAPGTNTRGRRGFYIHGGSLPGSAGCIDVGNRENDVLNWLWLFDHPMKVIVKY